MIRIVISSSHAPKSWPLVIMTWSFLRILLSFAHLLPLLPSSFLSWPSENSDFWYLHSDF
jgi:hypothetical protein